MKQFQRYGIGIIVLLALLGLIAFFYLFSINSASLNLLLAAYLITVALDATILILHVVRPHPPVVPEKFDRNKLTVFIVCYNGADILPETLRQAMHHVPPRQIIVISDNSTDDTVKVARAMGVQVYENTVNLNKSMSINRHIHRVQTPYTLILDDDTLIGKTFIPTSLLDAGYSAVAFNVMPVATGTLANRFQQFEYTKSMVIRKGLRSVTGSVGNVSGAIGLFHTRDLFLQSAFHSGQAGGEDQQRTILTHLKGTGKGVAYACSSVYTLAPDSLRALFKQRAFKWNTSAHENFLLMLRTILHPRIHYMLKIEKAYMLFILLTEPFRMLFFYLVLFAPIGSFATHLMLISSFYVALELVAWGKTGRETPLWISVVYPLYAKFCAAARFIAHFYWFKKKYLYSVKNKFHRMVHGRQLLQEYALVSLVLITLWVVAAHKLVTLLSSSAAGLRIPYSIPQWQPLESLPAGVTAIKLLAAAAVVWIIFRILRGMARTLIAGAKRLRRPRLAGQSDPRLNISPQ